MSIENFGYGGGLQKIQQTCFVTLFFLFGAFLCGLIIPKGQIHLGGKALYGTALLGESVLLMVAAFIPEHVSVFSKQWHRVYKMQCAQCTLGQSFEQPMLLEH